MRNKKGSFCKRGREPCAAAGVSALPQHFLNRAVHKGGQQERRGKQSCRADDEFDRPVEPALKYTAFPAGLQVCGPADRALPEKLH